MKKQIFFILLMANLNLNAQDIEKILTAARPSALLKNKELKISGQVSAGLSWYNADPINNRNVPFFYQAAGGIVIDIFGKLKLPFNFSYLNKTATSTLPGPLRIPNIQPFNRFQIKPKYKGFELQLGTGSMNFSKYTLNGHRFDGVGVQFKSQKFPVYGGFVRGRLLKKVSQLPEQPSFKPSYQRNGTAAHAGYKKDNSFLEFSILSAKDQLEPIDSIYILKNINPYQNIASSFKFKTTIVKNLSLLTDVGFSKIYNRNNLVSDLKKVKWKNAREFMIDYKLQNHTLGLNYQYIDPNYATLGSYFFNKDLEVIAVNYAGNFLNNQDLKVNTKIGHQRRNLNKTEPQTIGGWESAVDLNYKLKNKHTLSAAYSTFTSFSNFNPFFSYLSQTPYYENIDTLNFRQVNDNLAFMADIKLPMVNKMETGLIVNAMFQKGDDQNSKDKGQQTMQNYMTSFVVKNPENQRQASVVYNHVRNNAMGIQNTLSGPSVQVMLPFYEEKVNMNLQIGYTKSDVNNMISNYKEQSKVLMLNATIGLKFQKKHQLSVRYMLNNKFDFETEFGQIGGFKENTLRLSYKYAFDLIKISLKK